MNIKKILSNLFWWMIAIAICTIMAAAAIRDIVNFKPKWIWTNEGWSSYKEYLFSAFSEELIILIGAGFSSGICLYIIPKLKKSRIIFLFLVFIIGLVFNIILCWFSVIMGKLYLGILCLFLFLAAFFSNTFRLKRNT